MASMGRTRTARQTGYTTAANGAAKPAAAAPAKTDGWNEVSHTGRGKKPSSTCRMARPMTQPTPTPSATPRRAIWAPTSSGRRAMRLRLTPRAMAMPISRRWASTRRVVRLKAAATAPTKISMAKMLNVC